MLNLRAPLTTSPTEATPLNASRRFYKDNRASFKIASLISNKTSSTHSTLTMALYIRQLNINDLERSLVVETAAFPPAEAATREKVAPDR